MAFFKMTFFFSDTVDNVGWTENWWVSQAGWAPAIAAVANYAPVRCALLLDSSYLTAVRASNVDPGRDSLYQATGLPVQGTIARATYPPAGVWDCLLCRRDQQNNSVLGHIFLHQVPAGIFQGRTYTPSAVSGIGWVAKFAAYVTEVTNGTYALRQKVGGVYSYPLCDTFLGIRRTERRLGRPSDGLRGRRAVA